jgi:hypothetical protein
MVTASNSTPLSVKMNVRLTINPTLIRKIGMKKLFPIKDIRFIRAEVWGINLFIANPAKKAPIIGSIPATLARSPEINSIAKTKIYCDPLSPPRFLKNQVLTLGIPQSIKKEKTDIDRIILIQKMKLYEPSVAAEIKANKISAPKSVIIVPPIVTVTASLFVIPSLLAIGKDINVCVENILAVSNDASKLYDKMK